MSETFLTITPLGGLGEIGLNCQLWSTPAGVIMIDCGLMFPDDYHLGIDVIIPDFDAVNKVKDKLLGIILTHGHEDHIGALPWLIPLVKGVKIYGSSFTLALAEHKLRENGVLELAELVPVCGGDIVELGDLTCHFFPVCHSIPEGFALGFDTPVGRIVHSGDFKIDPDPLDGPGTDIKMFEEFAGESGVRLLLSDSTNVEREGHSLSEREVMDALDKLFENAPGRIIITLFSSHIHRIQEVFDLSRKYGRTVVISGKSLANNIEKATDLGFLRLPPEFYNAYNGVPDIPQEKTVLLVTGAQGEPLSALSRMVMGGHRQLSIIPGDTVAMSSRIIPGNAKAISRIVNEVFKLGGEVFHESKGSIHASGHAHSQELRQMIHAVRPQLFVPIHGEYRHLVKHARLAVECGVPADCAVLLSDGEPLTMLPEGIRFEEHINTDKIMVDGKGVGDVGHSVLKERHILGGEGLVVVVLVVDASGAILHGPQMISKGFVFEQIYDHLLEDAKCLVLDQLEEYDGDINRLKEGIRTSLRRFFRQVLHRDPIIVPAVSAV